MAIGRHIHNAAKWIAKHPAQSIAIAKETVKGVKAVKRKFDGKDKRTAKRRKHAPRSQIIGKGLAGATSTVSIVNKPPRKSSYQIIKHLGNTSQYVVNSVQGATSPAGLQNVNTYFIHNTQTDIQAMWTNGSAFYASGAVSNPISATPTVTGYKVSKFNLKRTHIKMELTNQSPSIANIELWTVMSKVTKPAYKSPGTDWTDGLADQDGATVNLTTGVGLRPTQSKLFNMNWKVKSVKKIQLMGGETHTHNSDFKVNRYIDSEYFNTYEQIRGITVVTFMIQWGQIADTINAANIGNITCTPTKVIASVQKVYTYSMVNIFPKNFTVASTALAQEPQPLLYVVNEEAGNILNVQDVTANVVYA